MVKRSCFKIIGIVLICLIPIVLPAQKFNRNNVRYGDNALKHNKFMEAVQWYTLAIDEGCKNYDIYFNRGIAYYKAGYYNSAIDDFYLALTYNENGEKAHLFLGKAMLIKNDLLGIKHLLLGGIEGMAIVKEFDLDENGQKVYRRDGHHYVVEPIVLVFNEDNYYVMTYSSRHESTATYRVDRMEAVTMIDESIGEKAVELRQEMARYTEQVFKMYSGKPEDVVLEFKDGLIGVVFDKFGEDTPMMRVGESKCVATVKVRVSPTFWGWLFQFAGHMRILSPTHLIDAYKARCGQITG